MRFFEDYKLGETFKTDARRITAGEVNSFVEYIGVRNPLFLDAKEPFGSRIVPGFLTQSLALGLLYQPEIIQNFLLVEAKTRFLEPVHVEDSIHVIGTVTQTVPTKGKAGLLTLTTQIQNQKNQRTAEMTLQISILKNPPHTKTPPINRSPTPPTQKGTPHADNTRKQPLPRQLAGRRIQTTPQSLRPTLQTELESPADELPDTQRAGIKLRAASWTGLLAGEISAFRTVGDRGLRTRNSGGSGESA